MFRGEPEGQYCCTECMVIVPFWFSLEHLWIVIAPFWFSTDDISTMTERIMIRSGSTLVCRIVLLTSKAKKKKNYVALTRPKLKTWVGRSGFFYIFFFTYRERVEFSNIFFKVSKWGKLGRNAVKTHIQVMQVLF